MTAGILPFQPEPPARLKARLPQALANPMDVIETMNRSPENAPGLHREHVFDFEGGIRLIVSVDMGAGLPGWTLLHVSASLCDGVERSLEHVATAFADCLRSLFDGYHLQLFQAADSGVAIHYWFYWPTEKVH